MDKKRLNELLVAIADKKIALSELNYADTDYDKYEEEVHDLEDELIQDFGEFLENAFKEVHKKLSIDTEVLLPTAYIGNSYEKVGTNDKGHEIYDVDEEEGVFVEIKNMNEIDTKLVLIPSPTRIVLIVGNSARREVWSL